MKNKEQSQGLNDNEQISLLINIEPNEIKINELPERIKIIVTNNSEVEYYGGLGYSLKFFNDNDWILINSLENATTLDLAITIEPFTSYELYDLGALCLHLYDFDFIPGKYRVNYDGFFGEFTIL